LNGEVCSRTLEPAEVRILTPARRRPIQHTIFRVRSLPELFDNNRRWAEGVRQRDPSFFPSLTAQQSPRYLWIGCSDSRVPANDIVGLLPGQLFVHRNVANLVVHTDLNCLSVLQYAVDVLRVEHVIVCGHYGCGGIRAVYERASLGLIDNWLRHVQDVRDRHEGLVASAGPEDAQVARLCELNVIEQVRHVVLTTIAQDAWRREQPLAVHGWIYDVADGLLRDLGFTVTRATHVAEAYVQALQRLARGSEAPSPESEA
jgi:carbonic anhydrase